MYNDLKNGTIIKFNSWNDRVNIGVINNNENGLYKVSTNSRINNIFVNSNQIIEIIDKSPKIQPVQKPVFIRVIEKPIPEPKKPIFQGIFAEGGMADGELPNELAIIIQEYDDEGTPVSKSAIENRIMQVTNFVKKHFGRFTIRDISNSHIDTNGNLVMKSSIIISSYPSDEEFNSNKLKLIKFLLVCAEDWGVKEIIFMYEEDTYYISPFGEGDMMKQGGELWIQDAVDKMKKKGTFGAFTKQAKREGLSPIEFTKKVLENPKGYTLKTRRRANFVKNMNQNKF